MVKLAKGLLIVLCGLLLVPNAYAENKKSTPQNNSKPATSCPKPAPPAQQGAQQAAQQKAAQEQAAAQQKATQEHAAKEAAGKAAKEKVAREEAEKSAREKAAHEAAAKEAAAKAAQEKATREAIEKAKCEAAQSRPGGTGTKAIVTAAPSQQAAKSPVVAAKSGADKTSPGQVQGAKPTVAVKNPLSVMKDGGYGWDEKGLAGVKYKGDGKGGVIDGKHNGVELKASPGTSVMAPEKGKITKAKYDKEHGQLTVEIEGESGRKYIFEHMGNNPSLLNEVKNKGGVPVNAGAQLGIVGGAKEDKWSSGPHLHMSVMDKNGKYIDPNTLFKIN